jgi:hypothetical protein
MRMIFIPNRTIKNPVPLADDQHLADRSRSARVAAMIPADPKNSPLYTLALNG